MKLIFKIILIFYSGICIKAQNIVPNPDFKESYHRKSNLLYPENWKTYGRFVYVIDDYKPYVIKVGKNNDTTYNSVKKMLGDKDSCLKNVLYMSYFVDIFGRKDNQSVSCKLNESLIADSIYEISVIIYVTTANCFSFKYFPIYFSLDYKPNYSKNKLVEVKLFNEDSSLISGGNWHRVSTIYKAKGNESYFSIRTNLDYKNILKITDLKNAKRHNIATGYSMYFDKLSIVKINGMVK